MAGSRYDEFFVLDSLIHAINFDPSNYADEVAGAAGAKAAAFVVANSGLPGYDYPPEKFISDFSVDDMAHMVFGESQTTVGVFNPQPLFVYKDGMTSLAKAAEAIEKYPNRFIGTYAAVDPLRDGWRAHLMEQADLLHPMGLKLYPASWQEKGVVTWQMNDPKVAFPVFELAGELGIRHIAMHKAMPIGPLEYRGAFNVLDFEGAAKHFPEMDFEIVHGGIAFLEETAWLLSKFPNIFVNMENMNIILARKPRAFARILTGLMNVIGDEVYNRLQWGTGTFQYHPRPCVEAMIDFTIPEDMLEETGMFVPVSQINDDHKRNILGLNFARRHGIDVEEVTGGTAGDQFWHPGEDLPKPYSTLSPEKALV
jgi:hypothetical protein